MPLPTSKGNEMSTASPNRAGGKLAGGSLGFLLPAATAAAAAQEGHPGLVDPRSPHLATLIDFEARLESADPFDISHKADRGKDDVPEVRPGQLLRVVVHGKPRPGNYTYPVNQTDP